MVFFQRGNEVSNQLLDREGNFRIQIVEYSLKEFDSGSVCVSLRASVLEEWSDEAKAWTDWRPYKYDVIGDVFVVNKKGELLEKSIQSLVNFAAWDANFDSVANGHWQPAPCQCSVAENTYNDQKSFKINFINPWDWTPGGGGGVSPEKAKELSNRFGSQLRALAGNVKRNAPPDQGSNPTPPKKPPVNTANANKAMAEAAASEGTPF